MLQIYRIFTCILLLIILWQPQARTQVVAESQQSLVVKKTATWCSNCGSWGWNWFKDILAAAPEKGGICLNLHSTSSTLKPPNDLDGEWLNQFSTVGGFPTFYVDGTHQTSVQNVMNAVEANYQSDPVAGVGLDAAVEDGLLQVRGKVEFFQVAGGHYYLGFYLIEDSVVAQQSVQGANAIHRYVVRDALESAAFGEDIHEGAVTPGQTFSREVHQDVQGMGHERMHVLAILWNKTGGNYQYVNGWMSAVVEGTLSSTRPEILAGWNVFPNPVHAGQVLTIEGPESYQAARRIALYSVDGRIVFEQILGGMPAQLTLPAHLTQGMYYLRSDDGALIRAIQVD